MTARTPAGLQMSQRIAFKPEDRFVVAIGNRIVVTTKSGDVFGYDVSGHRIGDAFQFTGTRVAADLQDRFVAVMGHVLLVTTRSGEVFGHDVSGHDIGPAFKLSGAKAAFDPQTRFVITTGNTLLVMTYSGEMFGHDISGRHIGPVFELGGTKTAFAGQDRFVVAIGNLLVLITSDGDVFGREVTGRSLGQPFRFSGSRIAFHPQDRFVVTVGNAIVVTTRTGDAFGAEVSGHDIGPSVLLNPSDVQTFDAIDAGGGSHHLQGNPALGGSAHLVVTDSGTFTFNSHAHDCGFDNMDYTLGAVLMTPAGLAFTFEQQGSVEGTVAGLPLGTPRRDDNRMTSGSNPVIKAEFNHLRDATFVGKLAVTDTLVAGAKSLIAEAVTSAVHRVGLEAATTIIALV
jgi:hypothetical protein